MRERFAEAGTARVGRTLTIAIFALIAVWVGLAGVLDKRWYEVVADAAPSLIVALALLRVPAALRAVAERMVAHERDAGEDPDWPLDDGDTAGPEGLAV